jgi:hypothetical protein
LAELSNEDLERLASRLAMLVSEGGEAENAGRAVAALARRLGLSGGQLKAFFLAGATQGGHRLPNRAGPDAAGRIDELQREISALRHGLKLTEAQARNAQRERDALRTENNMLVDALDRSRSSEQVRRLIAGVVVAAVVLVAAVISIGPALRAGPMAGGADPPAQGSPFMRSAVVRTGGANVLREPEQGALTVTQLPKGVRVNVRQTLWRGLMQWAEIEVGGVTGYVMSTEIDIS